MVGESLGAGTVNVCEALTIRYVSLWSVTILKVMCDSLPSTFLTFCVRSISNSRLPTICKDVIERTCERMATSRAL